MVNEKTVRFPDSISAHTPFLECLRQSVDDSATKLRLPAKLIADGNFTEEAQALLLVGHCARTIVAAGRQNLQVEAESAELDDAHVYAAHRLLSYRSASTDPKSRSEVLPRLHDPFLLRVRRDLLSSSGLRRHPNGRAAFMMAAGSSREGFPDALHQADGGVIGEADFERALRALVEAVGQRNAVANLKTVNVSEDWFYRQFTLLLRELYLNAYQHGRKSEGGKTLRRCLRVVSARQSTLSLDNLRGNDAFTAQLSPFWRRCLSLQQRNAKLLERKMTTRAVPLLELSVVDNGPGLVRTWLANEKEYSTGMLMPVDLSAVSLEKEMEVVAHCFQKHATTKPDVDAGLGLYDAHKVMSRLGGMLIVRTSRVHVASDYSVRNVSKQSVPFVHWNPNVGLLPEISGLSMTALIPLVPGVQTDEELQ